MSECLACTCRIIVAMDAINNVRNFIDDFVQEPPEKPWEVDERIVQDRINNAIHALDDAAQVCNLNLEEVKVKVKLTNLAFQDRKWYVAFDHILDAKAKLETKVCRAGL